jgi:hypothetical protein
MKHLKFLLAFAFVVPLITQAQYVGIGTTNPQYQLDVKGLVRLDSGIMINNVMVISANNKVTSDTGNFKTISVKGVLNTDSIFTIGGLPMLRYWPSNGLGVGFTGSSGINNTYVGQAAGLNAIGNYNVFSGTNVHCLAMAPETTMLW